MMSNHEIYLKDKRIFEQVVIADSFLSRLQGLMFRKNMDGFDAMVIESCNSIHTFFMRFSIDVFFISSKNEVVKIIREMKPCRMTRPYFKAVKVIETLPNQDNNLIQVGDEVNIKCIS